MSSKIDYAKKNLIAKKALMSSQFEKLRKERIEAGAVPWTILKYKRVVVPQDLPFPIELDSFTLPQNFEAQCKYIATQCKPMSLSMLMQHIELNKPVPPKTVIVTFDGGHADNYLEAFPILLKHGIPATFFIPTFYISNNTLPYGERLTYLLSKLRNVNFKFPDLKFLNTRLREQIKQISPEGVMNEELIQQIAADLYTAPSEERLEMMLYLASLIDITGPLPEYEDFMRWEDIKTMHSMGYEFASMGHACISTPSANAADFIDDLDTSILKLKENDIQPSFCSNSTYNVNAKEVLTIFGEFQNRFTVVDGTYMEPRFQIALPMLLGRVPIGELNSHSTEVFACRIWQLEIAGISF